MEKLVELRKKLAEEDNDLKALGIGNQIIREERLNRFESYWLEKITTSPKITQYQTTNNGYTFWFTDGNIIDFYPKANKLLIRKKNKWVKPALEWIVNELGLNN